MIKNIRNLSFLLLFTITGWSQSVAITYESEHLKIIPITKNSYLHISYLNTDSFGKVACNGLVYINGNESIVFDTPSDNASSLELIKWLVSTKKTTINAVVINHFHEDCLGGLEAFHTNKIASYANNKTIELSRNAGSNSPQIGFATELILMVGQDKIINRFFGEAHTVDNIVSYIPKEEVLFGGCMVKALNGPKGNLADANINAWSNTIQKIKMAFPKVKTVIPGHGKPGGTDLLDYTITLFNRPY